MSKTAIFMRRLQGSVIVEGHQSMEEPPFTLKVSPKM
jgi:hypothetical protein